MIFNCVLNYTAENIFIYIVIGIISIDIQISFFICRHLLPVGQYGVGSGYVLGGIALLAPLRAYACGSSSIARWGIRRANADWERPGGRLSN